MKLSNYIDLAFKNVKRNKIQTIIFIIIISIFFVIINLYSSTIITLTNYVNSIYNNDIDQRMLKIDLNSEDRDAVIQKLEALNINHVVKIYPSNLEAYKYVSTDTFNNQLNGSGTLKIYGIYPGTNLQLISGHLPQNDWELICSNTFYPTSDDYFNIKTNDLINLKKYLNKDINISYQQWYFDKEYNLSSANEALMKDGTYEHKKLINNFNHNMKLVGIYNSTNSLYAAQTCYTTSNTLNNIISENDIWEDNNLKKKEYKNIPILIQLDEYKNMEEVRNSLINNGFSVEPIYYLEQDFYDFATNYNKYIYLFLLVVISIIIILFINNNYKRNTYNIALYKALGFRNKNISKILLLENSLLILISFIISIILTIIIYLIINNIINLSIAFKVLNIQISFVDGLIYLFILFIITFLLTKIYMYKIKKSNPSKLLGE